MQLCIHNLLSGGNQTGGNSLARFSDPLPTLQTTFFKVEVIEARKIHNSLYFTKFKHDAEFKASLIVECHLFTTKHTMKVLSFRTGSLLNMV